MVSDYYAEEAPRDSARPIRSASQRIDTLERHRGSFRFPWRQGEGKRRLSGRHLSVWRSSGLSPSASIARYGQGRCREHKEMARKPGSEAMRNVIEIDGHKAVVSFD